MKKIILLLILSLLCISCGMNKRKILDEVEEEFIIGQVFILPNESYKFIAVEGCNIYFVKSMNLTNTDITTKYKLPVNICNR